jgi:hypothetical protein
MAIFPSITVLAYLLKMGNVDSIGGTSSFIITTGLGLAYYANPIFVPGVVFTVIAIICETTASVLTMNHGSDTSHSHLPLKLVVESAPVGPM